MIRHDKPVGRPHGQQVQRDRHQRDGDRPQAGVVLSAPTTPVLLRSEDNPDGVDESLFEAARTAMVGDIGTFLAATPASDYFGEAYDVSPARAEWTRRQMIDTTLPVLLETLRTFSRLRWAMNWLGSDCRSSSSTATPTVRCRWS
jgi:hypothetical protein